MVEKSALSDKKDKINNPPTVISNTVEFFKSLLGQLLLLVIVILSGSLILYKTKIAQSNILPTCMDFSPYTNISPPIKPIVADINIIKVGSAIMSTKITIPLEENIKAINDGFIGTLKNMINGPKTNVFNLYIATTIEEVIANNFTIVNTFYNFLNIYFSEMMVIVVGPFLSAIMYFFTIAINFGYMFVLWFYNIHLIFSEKTETANNTTWKSGDMWAPGSLIWTLLCIWIFFVLFFVVGIWLIIPIVSISTAIFCVFFPYFITSKSTVTGKPYGIKNTILNVLKYKLPLIMILASLLVILNASSVFGGLTAFVAVIACAILYFFTNVYKSYTPKGIDHATAGLGDYIQSVKKCIPPVTPTPTHTPTTLEKLRGVFF